MVGDIVETTRDIQSFVIQGNSATIKADAIPKGTRGTITTEDIIQGVVSVSFLNGVIGNFGTTLVDKLDAIKVLTVITSAIDMMAEETMFNEPILLKNEAILIKNEAILLDNK